jgi:hypothetical protein
MNDSTPRFLLLSHKDPVPIPRLLWRAKKKALASSNVSKQQPIANMTRKVHKWVRLNIQEAPREMQMSSRGITMHINSCQKVAWALIEKYCGPAKIKVLKLHELYLESEVASAAVCCHWGFWRQNYNGDKQHLPLHLPGATEPPPLTNKELSPQRKDVAHIPQDNTACRTLNIQPAT